MCGIFGYVGNNNNAAKIVFAGLRQLEYRGYDSWGIAVRRPDIGGRRSEVLVEKHVGKLPKATFNSRLFSLNSNAALGHTRWATHGGVTNKNAHPHLDCSGQISVVHNGIVENYGELKKGLKDKHTFRSETDTEVIVHLVEELSKEKDFKSAVRAAFKRVKGLNVFIFLNDRGEIIAVKNGSPLVLGLGSGENYIASDPGALIKHSRKAVFLEDNKMVSVGAGRIEISDLAGRPERVKTQELDWEVRGAPLGKFKHYMIKEIFEQPGVLERVARNGVKIAEIARVIKKAKGTFFIGCGSASYAALSGSYLFSKIAREHVNFSIGSEFNYLEHYLNRGSLVIAVSQSGETMDVVQSVLRAKEKGARVVALTNVEGSTLWRLSDHQLPLLAGPERAVCATKSFSAMVANMIYLSYQVAGEGAKGKQLVLSSAKGVAKVLTNPYILRLRQLAKKLTKVSHIYVIGRGLSYATALEATLKLKEVPYVHSEGFAGGELKHGVIALIEKGTVCIVFAPEDETYDDIISNAIEIKSRGGYIIGVSPKSNEVFDFYLPVEDAKEGSIIVNTVPVQLLSYYLALEKKLDPDMPRNLAKSVTVK